MAARLLHHPAVSWRKELSGRPHCPLLIVLYTRTLSSRKLVSKAPHAKVVPRRSQVFNGYEAPQWYCMITTGIQTEGFTPGKAFAPSKCGIISSPVQAGKVPRMLLTGERGTTCWNHC